MQLTRVQKLSQLNHIKRQLNRKYFIQIRLISSFFLVDEAETNRKNKFMKLIMLLIKVLSSILILC